MWLDIKLKVHIRKIEVSNNSINFVCEMSSNESDLAVCVVSCVPKFNGIYSVNKDTKLWIVQWQYFIYIYNLHNDRNTWQYSPEYIVSPLTKLWQDLMRRTFLMFNLYIINGCYIIHCYVFHFMILKSPSISTKYWPTSTSWILYHRTQQIKIKTNNNNGLASCQSYCVRKYGLIQCWVTYPIFGFIFQHETANYTTYNI